MTLLVDRIEADTELVRVVTGLAPQLRGILRSGRLPLERAAAVERILDAVARSEDARVEYETARAYDPSIPRYEGHAAAAVEPFRRRVAAELARHAENLRASEAKLIGHGVAEEHATRVRLAAAIVATEYARGIAERAYDLRE